MPFATGLSLANIFTDHAVLQRSPSTPAVYGLVSGGFSGVNVTVTPDSNPELSYTVEAQHIERVNDTYSRWKAALRPEDAGTGSFTICATCVGCPPTSQQTETIRDVVFGEVWVCR